jgi:hypothetical protein
MSHAHGQMHKVQRFASTFDLGFQRLVAAAPSQHGWQRCHGVAGAPCRG